MTKAQKLEACFNLLVNDYGEKNPFIPHYKEIDWPQVYANSIFDLEYGNCFSYAAGIAYLAKAIGYTEVYALNSGGHGFAEIDGLVYDPEWTKNHTFRYYALAYEASPDLNYKGVRDASVNNAWMRVKI